VLSVKIFINTNFHKNQEFQKELDKTHGCIEFEMDEAGLKSISVIK
jgi:hypothetical protein